MSQPGRLNKQELAVVEQHHNCLHFSHPRSPSPIEGTVPGSIDVVRLERLPACQDILGSIMASTKQVIVSWSSGKDSAWAVTRLREDPAFEITGLFTIFSAHDRVFMHAVRPEIVHTQAQRIGVPLHEVMLPRGSTHEQYEEQMRTLFAKLRVAGASHVAFGDLYLEDVRQHRLALLSGTGLEPVFPLWQEDTQRLADEMIAGGLESYVTCVNLEQLDRSFVGERWDRAMIARFPQGTDPCGEQGEFHTCVIAGPMFPESIVSTLGEVIEREGYAFADLHLG